MKTKIHTTVILVLCSLSSFFAHAISNPNFSVAPNGITCLCTDAAIGETGELTINGVTQTYTKRTRAQLEALIDADQNDPQIALTCTSGIIDMSELFFEKTQFNQDISTWDVYSSINLKPTKIKVAHCIL
jgi:hypothetical protein